MCVSSIKLIFMLHLYPPNYTALIGNILDVTVKLLFFLLNASFYNLMK